ncbi:MAG TPA: ABC transporter ATP-binding protein [Xanthobacteraceae bacterium]|nr:ABC transporter ATP-binding protein [Xanthobacteraceae bacterium]
MPRAPIIEFSDVSKTYGEAHALEHVSLVVGAGEFLAIVGPSGSGKTTLLRLVNRLAEPSSGEVRVENADVRLADPPLLRRRIGYVFQGIGLFPHLTVAENIAITPRLIGWEKDKRAARADELLNLVRLDPAHYRDRLPAELSGGERQRVGVARALAAEPKIVLMDEPFGALDAVNRDAIGRDYRALHAGLGLTTVMITHDLTEAVLLADRIVVIHEGRLIEEGTPRELMISPKNAYVRELIETPRRQAERLGALLKGGA